MLTLMFCQILRRGNNCVINRFKGGHTHYYPTPCAFPVCIQVQEAIAQSYSLQVKYHCQVD